MVKYLACCTLPLTDQRISRGNQSSQLAWGLSCHKGTMITRQNKKNLHDTRETGSSRSSSVALVLLSTHLQFSKMELWGINSTPSIHHEVSGLSIVVITIRDTRVWILKSICRRGYDTTHHNKLADYVFRHVAGLLKWNKMASNWIKCTNMIHAWPLPLVPSFFPALTLVFCRAGMLTHGTVFHPLRRKCIIVHCRGTAVFF